MRPRDKAKALSKAPNLGLIKGFISPVNVKTRRVATISAIRISTTIRMFLIRFTEGRKLTGLTFSWFLYQN
ncbi:hypothetical protein [Mucilaginibacter humi]|uniref:hypothetical protein n=1 Tax=Mucilaginibacter humi TaxID=2732510 RepID=UPI001585896C|nr:hypothetical protein [Mucilaginibacter humi]